ncbi:MAG: hypothetical protein QOK49_4477 [Baekduia sp.]|jgi:hypothetical protein|nr:hypothetical protein [Baekduia sp.]
MQQLQQIPKLRHARTLPGAAHLTDESPPREPGRHTRPGPAIRYRVRNPYPKGYSGS